MTNEVMALALAAAGSDNPSLAPIACRPGALDAAGRRRQQDLLERVRGTVEAREELADGLAFRLPPTVEVLRDVAEWASLERHCCPFLAFTLEWRLDDTVWIRLTGGPGVKEFLAAGMGLSVR